MSHSPGENLDKMILADINRTLKDIGFPKTRDPWRESPAVIDPEGQTLRILGHPVMERWEESYMKKLAEIATSKAWDGRVLEVGFGLGISAGFIQMIAPREHIIIEANKSLAESARRFASQRQCKVSILEGFWRTSSPSWGMRVFKGFCSTPILNLRKS